MTWQHLPFVVAAAFVLPSLAHSYAPIVRRLRRELFR
ncbi:hypothetical protein S2M10_29630 [Sphingomonas sp. S2M10]|nr:hypothetical protein [Sphingomonas sp. S2M10]